MATENTQKTPGALGESQFENASHEKLADAEDAEMLGEPQFTNRVSICFLLSLLF